MTELFSLVTVPVLVCALTPGCLQQALDWSEKIREQGSWGDVSIEWTISNLRNAVNSWPKLPDFTTVFSDSEPLTVSPERREHILHGEGGEGGHLYGSGRGEKTEFPEDWTEDDIIGAIETIANDPSIPAETQPNGRLKKVDVIDGIEIEVIIDPVEGIVTGYPVY